jgi:hypothetical protein
MFCCCWRWWAKMLWRGSWMHEFYCVGKSKCCNLSLFFPLFITTSHFFLASCSTKTTIQWCACMHFVLYFHTSVLWFALQCKRVGGWCYKCLQPFCQGYYEPFKGQVMSRVKFSSSCIHQPYQKLSMSWHILDPHTQKWQPHQLFCMSLWITQRFSWTHLRKMCIKVIVEKNVTGLHVLIKHLWQTVNLQIS